MHVNVTHIKPLSWPNFPVLTQKDRLSVFFLSDERSVSLSCILRLDTETVGEPVKQAFQL